MVKIVQKWSTYVVFECPLVEFSYICKLFSSSCGEILTSCKTSKVTKIDALWSNKSRTKRAKGEITTYVGSFLEILTLLVAGSCPVYSSGLLELVFEFLYHCHFIEFFIFFSE